MYEEYMAAFSEPEDQFKSHSTEENNKSEPNKPENTKNMKKVNAYNYILFLEA